MASSAHVVVDVQPAQLERLGRSSSGSVYAYAVRLRAKVETAAKKNASGPIVGVRTGNLRSSIHSTTEIRGALLVDTIAADASYALAVHKGAKAYDIVPVKAKVLAWKSPAGNGFAMRVHMPARKGRPFLTEALRVIV